MVKRSFFQKIVKNQNIHVGFMGSSQFQVDNNTNACAKFEFDRNNFYACYFKAKDPKSSSPPPPPSPDSFRFSRFLAVL